MNSNRALLKDISDILHTEIPLPRFLEVEIPLPKFSGLARLALNTLQDSRKSGRSKHKSKVHCKSIPFVIEGSVTTGQNTLYAVGGEDFVIDNSTFIFGDVALGSNAKVKGMIYADGTRRASSVTIQR